MIYRRLFSGFILAILLTIGLLVNFAGLAKADVNEQEKTSFGRASLLSGLVLPPNARFEKPLLQNTPVLTITKIAPKEVTAGQTLTYTIIVSNSTITDATNAIITDTLDTSKLTFSLPLSASYNSGTVTWEPITITGLSLITRTLLVTVNADVAAGEILTNTVGVTSTEGAGDNDTVTSTIKTAADISISKSSNPTSTVVAGETLTYTLTITNAGPSNAQNVVVTDTLPASVTVLSTVPATNTQIGTELGWDLGELTVGATSTITMIVSVDGLARGFIENTATVTSTTIDPDPNNTAMTVTDVDAEVDLTLTKSDSPATPILNGSLEYTLFVTNNGPSDATSVQVIDTLPSSMFYVGAVPDVCSNVGNIVTCNLGTIANGGNAQVVLSVIPTKMGIFINQAQVSASAGETDTDTGNNIDTEETVVHPADLSITKSGPTSARVGYSLTYNLTVANNGPNDATNVVLTDTLPSSVIFNTYTAGTSTCNHSSGTVTCNLGNLTNGMSRDITIVVTPTVASTITNTAQISANNPDTITFNNTATETTTIDPVTDLSISKSADTDPVTAGESLGYTITITNDGPSDATGIEVTDLLSNDVTFVSADTGCSYNSGNHSVICTLSSLANGGNEVFNINVDVVPSKRGILDNDASITGYNEFDPDTVDHQANAPTTVIAEANLSISKFDNPDPVTAGESLTYTINIVNNGPSDATSIMVTDTLSSGVTFNSSSSSPNCTENTPGEIICLVSSINSGSNSNLTISVDVDSDVTGSLSNSAEVTATEPDPNTGNNDTSINTTVEAKADLDIAKTASPGAALPGDTITYVLTVYNNGPSDATGIVVTDTLPADVNFLSVTPGAPTCSGTGTIVCNLGDMAVNDPPIEVTIEVTVNEDAAGTISNQATVSGNEEDPSAGNNISPQVSTAIGEFNKVYLPLIMKPAPTNLYIINQTGAQVTFTVFGTGVSCNVAPGTHHCGDFPPGTYTVQAVAHCGTGTRDRTYDSGVQYTTVTCN